MNTYQYSYGNLWKKGEKRKKKGNVFNFYINKKDEK